MNKHKVLSTSKSYVYVYVYACVCMYDPLYVKLWKKCHFPNPINLPKIITWSTLISNACSSGVATV